MNEQNTRLLFNAYRALIQSFTEISETFLKGQITLNDLKGGQAYQIFKKFSGEKEIAPKDKFEIEIH